jgi:zinc protease
MSMIDFQSFQATNGLRVLVNEDFTTPLVAVNVLYNVGSRDERPEATGVAHLLEHLMFSGSQHVKNYDETLQVAGGDSNAITNADTTNFYSVVPAQNIETVLWMEADRMRGLILDPEHVDLEKKVVLEEFKENCLNPPFGDLWHYLMPLAYKVHPYKWPTIGKVPDHVEQLQREDLREFYDRFYYPNNAIVSISGGLKADRVFELVSRWFGPLNAGPLVRRMIPAEPPQKDPQFLKRKTSVPVDAIFMAFHMPGRLDGDYHATDLLSDVLGNGRSSRLFAHLIKGRQLFSQIDAYVTGNSDPGLFIIEGSPSRGISTHQAIDAIWNELDMLKAREIGHEELTKIRNKVETNLLASQDSILSKAINLAFFELLGDANMINTEMELYNQITPCGLLTQARKIFNRKNCSIVTYERT